MCPLPQHQIEILAFSQVILWQAAVHQKIQPLQNCQMYPFSWHQIEIPADSQPPARKLA
jgi:hypothetical protein